MRLRLLLFGRDVLELTATRNDTDLEPEQAEPFGFFGGSSLWIERYDSADDQPPEDRLGRLNV